MINQLLEYNRLIAAALDTTFMMQLVNVCIYQLNFDLSKLNKNLFDINNFNYLYI